MLKALEKARGNKVLLQLVVDLCLDIKPEFFKQRYRAIERSPYWDPSKYWDVHLILKTYIGLTCFDKPEGFKAPVIHYRLPED